MATKPKKQSKASKPDCKVWIQAGEELLPEYLNKPIEGVEGYECYIVVALNDLLSINCEAKPGVFDEYVLVVDGVIRGCEPRRNTKVVLDKALNRAEGKGKNPGAVFRSDMSVQMRDSDQSRLAEAGEELSKVGSIIIEGWSKGADPLSTKEKDGETLKFGTYEVNRKWYDLNRFVNPTPGHLPPFEIGFIGETRCAAGSGYRTRVAGAAERNTAEWKLSYKYIFHLRSASEMHKLGQTDVLVRNPKIDLFAEHPEEAAEVEAADVEEDDAEADEDIEEVEEVEEAEKPDDEIVVESDSEDNVEADEGLFVKPSNEEKPAQAKPEAKVIDKTGDDTAEVLKSAGALKKSKPKTKTVDKSSEKPEGKSDQKSAETTKKKMTPKPKSATHTGRTESMLSPSGSQVVVTKSTPKKKSLSGVKSAPASKASRIRSQSINSNASKVLQSIELPEELLMSPAFAKLADTSNGLPVTPPPSSNKRQSLSGAFEGAKTDRAIFSASPMALKGARQDRRVRSETRTYDMPGDFSFTRGQDSQTAMAATDDARGREDSIQSALTNPISRKVSFKGKHPSSRAQSEVSDVSTEVADPIEMQARMEREGWTSGSLSQGNMSFGRSQSAVTPEPRNHTKSSPVLGRSFTGQTQSEGSAEFLGVKYSQEQKVEVQESPSTQIRTEIAESFPVPVSTDKLYQKQSNKAVRPSQKISRASSLAVSFPKHQQSFSSQPEGFVAKRKASDTTGHGSIAENARPAKFPMPPANRAIIDSLRRQQEENDRLEQELKDLREYNTTLENIRELRKKGHGVQERIEAEKARQAALEAELGQ